jgi:CheY-like chemotaxis protein
LPPLKAGTYVRITVADNGVGMEAKVLQRAFDPFFTTKPIGQGTGLGLSMIHGFARQSNGNVVMRSEVGKGTEVDLYLPAIDTAIPEEAAPQITETAGPAGETVLVVEDDPIVRSLIVDVLSELSCRTLQASDGPSGVEILLSQEPIDLLVTDIGLPGLNGRQVADAGRQYRPDLKVLFITGYAENAAAGQGFLESGMAMLAKPFPMEILASKIKEMIPPSRSVRH